MVLFMIKKITIGCLLTFAVWGEETLPMEFEKTFLYKEENIVVKTEKKELTDILVRVYRGKEVIFRYQGGALEKRLRRVNFVSHLLFLFWKSGQHGETLTVFDIDKKNIVWENFSTWPMGMVVDKGKVKIDYTGKRLEVDKYEEFTKIIYIN